MSGHFHKFRYLNPSVSCGAFPRGAGWNQNRNLDTLNHDLHNVFAMAAYLIMVSEAADSLRGHFDVRYELMDHDYSCSMLTLPHCP